ncbi:hypothetical protein MIMGU_mgv1a003810mg [Erythranthe guttata]|uniref:IQ domain-containing protein IQM2-like n=1 Tax=Erythranthe guttata TaxID=4155 RepID=A0A022QSH6_ERYGU|nr:PREDICTED: uncharacterized protein LOC105964263 [Erythranthe guttata]EYU31682.1 hypothetical protein MIMGU_mgv1a003810mg [Erythranthe guttata]|eukprot:XP_012844242.1 PREDICTED: uncharacterized protein LOC105964263 [Erythranthe guttata]
MGVSWSCPLAVYFDLENALESAAVKSFNLSDNEQNSPVRSVSLERKDSEPRILQSSGSGKLLREGSIRYRSRKAPTTRFTEMPPENITIGIVPNSCVLDPISPKHEAALKLQKVYKSFRTRRKLADCAVLIEQSWWKLLDFAELKHSSISFFDIEKHETAISRWSRARTRAAKVGKGLSKNSKAQKLALQHWLEAIDPRHRYGHNLHFYYVKWLNSQSKEPFFYWLDIGEGKEVIIEKCPRPKLQQQCIKYLGPMERKTYEVAMEEGKLFYKETGEFLDTTNEPKGCKWIFVLSTSRTLYVGKKTKGSFQHSSFLAGGATLAAGRILAEKGILKAVWPHSGHYRPTPENFQDLISFLMENNVDLTDVKLDSTDDEEEESIRKHMRNNSSEDDLAGKEQLETEENDTENSGQENELRMLSQGLSKLSTLQIPSNDDLLDKLKSENEISESLTSGSFLLDENMSEDQDETITEHSVLERINSHKGMKSFQLGKQLSCKWSTGAGPRIGCLRDYPSGLQSHALEQVNLSPRSNRRLRFDFPSRTSTPNSSSLSRSNSHSLENSFQL